MSGQPQILGHQYSPRLPPFRFRTICIQIVLPLKAAGYGAHEFTFTFALIQARGIKVVPWPQAQAHVDVGTNDSNTPVWTLNIPKDVSECIP